MKLLGDFTNLVRKKGGKDAARHIFRRFCLEVLVGSMVTPLKSDYAKDQFHTVFKKYLEETNRLTQHQILELGSRSLTGEPKQHAFTGFSKYVGFDICSGQDVDVVGDIHQLSSYLGENQFDSVYSISVFEHLAMPWKAVLEINKVMKPGGLLFIATHPTWPLHELPWDFFRFSKASFDALLNPYTGFEILACEEGLPCSIVPLVNDASMGRMPSGTANLAVAVLARKTGAVDARLKWDVTTSEVINTMYPRASENVQCGRKAELQ